MDDSTERSRMQRVLVVEDVENELCVLSDILRDEGFAVIGCRSATEALEHVRDESFGVAIVDLSLPDLDGTKLLEEINRLGKRVRVVIYTGDASFNSAKAAVNLGAFAYVEKLSDPAELLRHVHRACREHFDLYAQDLERAIAEKDRAEEALRREQQLLKHLLDRQMLAYEIHDGPVQYVTGVVMRLDTIREHVDTDPELRGKLEHACELLRQCLLESRRLIAGLRPPVLDELGIVPALEMLITEVSSQSQVNVQFEHQAGLPRLAKSLETVLYRIVQEALTNVERHSQSKTAAVRLTHDDGEVFLEIQDWGKGFDAEIPAHGRFGVQGIRERARLLGGRAQIESRRGEGTTVRVALPCAMINQVERSATSAGAE